jgi:hypothetical protein
LKHSGRCSIVIDDGSAARTQPALRLAADSAAPHRPTGKGEPVMKRVGALRCRSACGGPVRTPGSPAAEPAVVVAGSSTIATRPTAAIRRSACRAHRAPGRRTRFHSAITRCDSGHLGAVVARGQQGHRGPGRFRVSPVLALGHPVGVGLSHPHPCVSHPLPVRSGQGAGRIGHRPVALTVCGRHNRPRSPATARA